MLTNKFKATIAVAAGLVVAGGLTANQVIQQKEIKLLQDTSMIAPKVVKVIVTPSATPTATPTASFKFVPKVTTPVK